MFFVVDSDQIDKFFSLPCSNRCTDEEGKKCGLKKAKNQSKSNQKQFRPLNLGQKTGNFSSEKSFNHYWRIHDHNIAVDGKKFDLSEVFLAYCILHAYSFYLSVLQIIISVTKAPFPKPFLTYILVVY